MNSDTEHTSREPRHDVNAEQIILGAMMLNSDAVIDAEMHLTATSFYPTRHQLIFSAIVALAAAGEPTDPVAVAGRLLTEGDISKIGGAEYLHECVAATPIVAQAGYYAKIVAGLAQLRALDVVVAQSADLVARAGHADADSVTEQIIDKIVNTDRASASNDGPRRWRDMIGPLLDEIEARGKIAPGEADPNAVPSGLIDLDNLLGGGAKPGQLIVIAGRPGGGKSVTAVGWAQHAAMDCGIPSAIFSLEMGATELNMRMTSAATGIPLKNIKKGQLADSDWSKVGRWVGETERAPLFIDATATLTVGDIRARARRLRQRHGVRLIVVDYLQLVSSPRAESRQVAVAAMSRAFKLLAKELECSVIILAQLNRGPEARTDKKPEVSDLRESGSIEADADVVILTHAMEDDSPRAGEIDLIVGKHRDGPRGTVTCAAQLHLVRLASLAVTE